MASNFGPWATTLDMGLGVTLGKFWRRRIAMLPFAKHAGQTPSRPAAAILILFATVTLAAPMLSLSPVPAAPPESAADSQPSPAVTAAATDGASAQADAKTEPLPAGMPLEAIPVPGQPNAFMKPVGLATVAPAPLLLQGSLFLDVNRLSRVHSRFAGEVVSIGTITPPPAKAVGYNSGPPTEKRPLRVGDFVHRGDVLAIVWSKEIGEKKSDLVDALTQMHLDEADFIEVQQQQKAGLVSKRQVRDAERKLETDRIAVDRIERTLRSWRLTETEIAKIRADAGKKTDRGQTEHDATLDTAWGEVDVRAPFDGTILERNATAGDTIDTDLDLFKIADLSRLAVLANAPAERASELNALAPEQRWWSIDLWPGPNREPISGYFDTVGEIIDPAQRTVSIMGTVDNKAGMLRAGQMITATIAQLGASGHQVAFPVSALVPVVGTDSDGAKVWVEIDAAKPSFDWRPAHVARQMAGTVICELSQQEAKDVTNPLRVGARVVVWGPADPPEIK